MEQDDTKTLEDLNFSITNSVYNLANTTPNFITSPSVNYSCNISSKMNDALILSESYFMIEYTVVTGAANALLIPNWFLSMLNSMNFNINSYSFQLNSISAGRSFPMLVQTLRYLQYEQQDYSKYSKVQQEYFQDFQNPTDQINIMDAFRPTIFNSATTTTGYIVLNLKDLIPVIDTINQCTGLLSFSFVLNFDPAIQCLSNAAAPKLPTSFTIQKINFHYPIKTYDSDQVMDVDINYFRSLGILQGRNPQEQLININNAAANGTFNSIGSNKYDITVSNIQLSTNQIFKLLIFPVFTATEVIAPANNIINYFSQDGNSSEMTVINRFENLNTDNFNITNAARNNYKRSIDYLLTPIGSIGSPLFGVTNLKVVVNGNTISPSNITPNYISSNTSDYYQYFYGFDQSPINRFSKPNLFFNYNMYKNFSPIVVDIANATSKNAYNSLTFSYTLFNKFTLPNLSPLIANNIKLDTYYTVLNLQVLND
jgi:hypothetical protein